MPKIISPESYIAYNVTELKALFPDSFRKAHERWAEVEDLEFQTREGIASYKAIIDALGFKIKDYELSVGYGYNTIRLDDMEGELQTKDLRAWKYVQNRISPYYTNKWFKLSDAFKPDAPPYVKQRKESWGKPWNKHDCPFTGVCYDDILTDYLLAETLKVETLERALKNTWDHLSRMLESELEYLQSEDHFLESCDDLFTESGRMI